MSSCYLLRGVQHLAKTITESQGVTLFSWNWKRQRGKRGSMAGLKLQEDVRKGTRSEVWVWKVYSSPSKRGPCRKPRAMQEVLLLSLSLSPPKTLCFWGLPSLHTDLCLGNLGPLSPGTALLLHQDSGYAKPRGSCWAEAKGATLTGEAEI